jgi:hypothetical protein
MHWSILLIHREHGVLQQGVGTRFGKVRPQDCDTSLVSSRLFHSVGDDTIEYLVQLVKVLVARTQRPREIVLCE